MIESVGCRLTAILGTTNIINIAAIENITAITEDRVARFSGSPIDERSEKYPPNIKTTINIDVILGSAHDHHMPQVNLEKIIPVIRVVIPKSRPI